MISSLFIAKLLSETKFANSLPRILIRDKVSPPQRTIKALVDGCDLLVNPTTPDALAPDALMLTTKEWRELGEAIRRAQACYWMTHVAELRPTILKCQLSPGLSH
jgi:hypothetical protein